MMHPECWQSYARATAVSVKGSMVTSRALGAAPHWFVGRLLQCAELLATISNHSPCSPDMTMEPSLQTIATYLADSELAANPASLPVALARALAGEGAWEGLGLLSGSSITDIATALDLFCTQYGPENWAALLRQELPT